ncbi:MAG: acetate--CoA ligase family protein [Betaproteobacteria bacterium]|nr:acetate--CoA ligase family protein [Betaproteobacteria bacterium]MDH3435445.1 acetate--CoA ligase family protein [Betaproteobacteria bacterium]
MDSRDLIVEARKRGRATLDEQAGKWLLAAYGVAVPASVIVPGAAGAAAAFECLKPPVVVKVMSPDILHKSEARAVRLNVASAVELAAACEEILANARAYKNNARIDGFLVEEMAPAGQEMVIGGLRDPQFGPLVMVGLGGIFVEVLADVAFRICPIERRDAEEMLDELKGAAILKGARGRKPVSREAIVETLLRIGGERGLLMDHAADIKEADINPLIVSERGAVAVDARFVLSKE